MNIKLNPQSEVNFLFFLVQKIIKMMNLILISFLQILKNLFRKNLKTNNYNNAKIKLRN